MKSILIVKTSSIGDIIHTFPVLDYLRIKFPNARIDWAVEKSFVDLLSAHPQIDNILVADTRVWRRALANLGTLKEIAQFFKHLRSEKYDLVIDLQGNSKSAFITGFTRANEKIGFDWKSVPEKPNWFVLNKRYAAPKALSVRAHNLHIVKTHFQDRDSFSSSSVKLKI